ncbi:hypothetical protein K504DRAFT_477100 [Pleomassaria siparia CBS 279.74]|uniref:CENP-V/GFA domain-containing protein n=1 Tax=Pleomassaria siparia CBS 279.74 TaxID=1314801 RepID=A0A6G1K823_9PLEO|nr:hypothetical protein K504DRAFT_477100 [Pleomassaria siparia CBS 279.74]
MSTTGVHHGSCHCGFVQYQIRLTFPPIPPFLEAGAKSVKLYKCNCTVCQKMGFFHCRPININDDFILTSPSNIQELGDYRVFAKRTGWYFCKTCGVRTFGMSGTWEQDEIDVGTWSGKQHGDGTVQKVWKSKSNDIDTEKDGKKITKPYHYLSVNAVTLEGGDGGVDLKEWHEKGWLYYVENREKAGNHPQPQPFHCGMY